MSAAVEAPPEVLVPRPDHAAAMTSILASIHAAERTRRRKEILLTIAPWLMSGIFGMYALGAGYIVAQRPVPQDRMHLAIYRADGPVSAPVELEDGSVLEVQKQFFVKADLQAFIVAWESYNFRRNQDYYNRVSTMTAGEHLQAVYQDSWTNRRDPENREVKYGEATARDIPIVTSSYVPASPNALTARMVVRQVTPTGTACEYWAVDLTFRKDRIASIPIDKRLAYDPTGTVVVSYFSRPADPSAKPVPC